MPASKIEIATAPKKADALVLGFFQEESSGTGRSEGKPSITYVGKRSKDIDALLGRLRESKHFAAKKAETDLLRFQAFGDVPNLVLLGLGTAAKWDPEIARQTGAGLALLQRRAKLERVALVLDSLFGETAATEMGRYLQAFCEGYWLAGHEYNDMKKKRDDAFEPAGLTLVGAKVADFDDAIRRARLLADAVTFTRGLGDRPGNFCTPTFLAKEAQRMARERGLKCRVLGRAEIEKEKMGLLAGVARGSHEDPRFIVLEYNGGKKSDKPICLVGKGVTFDSGGISIKPAGQMEDMKYDMMGAATVLGVFQAVADLKLPVRLMGFIAATENMPGGSAQKPGDVMKSRRGKTVEIVNTDAEGRLILADALEYAQDHEPQAILDFATLTGGVVVALGSVATGIMGNHKELIERVKEASTATGERVWELPLYDEYEEDLKSSYADIRNSGNRDASAQKGGIFLRAFVDKKVPWVHCDIAGTAYHRKDLNYLPAKFASGVMVRLVSHLLETWRPLETKR